ncbi:MAG: hypothetical protein ACK4MQ_07660 [Hyphomonas sp.]
MPRHETNHPEPYPGLRSYDDTEALFFAGREQDIRDCSRLLVESQVLVLHGRTGCGKSSFLRAGIKPRVSRLKLGLNFSESFVVIRSTAEPLRRLVRIVLGMTTDLLDESKPGSDFGALDEFADRAEMERKLRELGIEDIMPNPKRKISKAKAAENVEKAIDLFSRDGRRFVDVLTYVASNMQEAPIFVIDQGEEVFTMANRSAKEQAPSPGEVHTNQDIGRNDEAVQFFRFLHRFATHARSSRIVISLRTEYKGLFDDRITENGPDQRRMHPGRGLTGYFLKELGEAELRQAILRPTLKESDADWLEIADSQENKALGKIQAPFEEYRFSIDEDVVEDLVKGLLGDDIPYGGVLPAMQVACLRLWRQSKLARRRGDGNLVVERMNLLRLGKIGNQVEEYLLETIEVACGVPYFRGRISESIDAWMSSLTDKMVRVEADGRAVTRATTAEELLADLAGQLMRSDGGQTSDDVAVKREAAKLKRAFEEVVVTLKHPSNNILKDDMIGQMITLGHDSLALALRKWAILNRRDSMAMMMRMGMGAVKPPEELERGDLFLKEDPPHTVKVFVPRDYHWDRHLPQFAKSRNLGERLGIEFVVDDEALDALRAGKGGPRKWDDLSKTLREKEEEFGSAARYKDNNRRILVAANWGAFPGNAPEELKPGKKDPREAFASKFSDILVSNVSVGNQLIGPPDKKIGKRREDLQKATDPAKRQEDILKLIRESFCRLRTDQATVTALDRAGRDLLVLAAKFAWSDDDPETSQANIDFAERSGNVRIRKQRNYGPSDPLISDLMIEADEEDETGAQFVVGNANTYAMALQCGFVPYFGTKMLSELAKYEMERRKTEAFQARVSGGRKDQAKLSYTNSKVQDITGELQNVVTHTLWQLGIEPTKWSQGLNRAMVLRFASVGYFTVEYARTNMRRFISYIHEFMGEVMDLESELGGSSDSGKVGRLTQRSINEAIAECFYFFRFDDYGPEVYDLDARLAYWSDHGALNTKSVAGEIYNELVRLRQKTIESFGQTAQAIAWMRVSGDYNPATSEKVSKAFRMKELAWNNFRIFNFFDSERYMTQAAILLQEEMEDVFQRGKGGGN